MLLKEPITIYISDTTDTPDGITTAYYKLNTSSTYTTDYTQMKAKDAGSYNVLFYLKGNDNYEDSASPDKPWQTGKILISKADLTDDMYTAPTIKTNLTYNGAPRQIINGGSVTNDQLTIYYKLGDNGTWTDNPADISAKNVGDYDVYWYVDGGNNYTSYKNQTTPNMLEVSISQATIAPNTSAADKTYDGTANADDAVTVSFTGLVESETLVKDVDYTVTSAYDTKNVGSNKSIVSTITLKNTSLANNYILSTNEATCTGNITPAHIHMQSATVYDKDYDGTRNAILKSVSFVGLKNNETLTQNTDYTADAKFETKDVGNNKKVTININLTNSNYIFDLTGGSIDTRANINALNATLPQFDDKTSPYTQNPISHEPIAPFTGVTAVSYTYTGKGDTTYESTSAAPSNAGTYTVTASFTMDEGYAQLSPLTATLTISQAVNIWETSPSIVSSWTYGEPPATIGQAEPLFGTYRIEYKQKDAPDREYSMLIPIDAGEYTAKFVVLPTANYSGLTDTMNFAVTPKTIDSLNTDILSFDSMTYTGFPQTPNAEVKLKSNNRTITGNWSNVTNVTDTTTFTASGNYQGTLSGISTGMNKKDITFTTLPTATNPTYSGTLQELITPAVSDAGTVKYSLDNLDWQTDIPEGTDATTSYTVYYKAIGDDNHNDTDVNNIPATIAKKPIENATVNKANNLTYNGSYQTQNVTVTVDGLTATFDISNNTAKDVKVDGNYKLTVAGTGNFTGSKDFDWNIQKAATTPSTASPTSAIVLKGLSLSTATIKKGDYFDLDGNPLEGTLTWVNPNNQIINDCYEDITFTPNNTNYALVTTSAKVLTYTSDNEGSNLPSSRNDKNSDGSVTTTIVNKLTDTITQTTKYPDGTVVITETQKDGTVTTTQKEPNGRVKVTTIAPDGTKITNDTMPDGTTVVTTDKDGDISAVVTPTKVQEVTVTIPVKNSDNIKKVTLITIDGNEREVTDFKTTDNGIEISVNEACTVKLSYNSSSDSKKTFSDVDDTFKWAKYSIDFVYANGIMQGISNDLFGPDESVTRGMLVTILYRNEGSPKVSNSAPFNDISKDMYYYESVIWAKENGIVSGISETEFAPGENITREEIAAIFFRYAKLKGYDVFAGDNTNILSYTDFDEISEYATDALQYAVGSGLITGKTESTLNPRQNATRAEIAVILQRFVENNR